MFPYFHISLCLDAILFSVFSSNLYFRAAPLLAAIGYCSVGVEVWGLGRMRVEGGVGRSDVGWSRVMQSGVEGIGKGYGKRLGRGIAGGGKEKIYIASAFFLHDTNSIQTFRK